MLRLYRIGLLIFAGCLWDATSVIMLYSSLGREDIVVTMRSTRSMFTVYAIGWEPWSSACECPEYVTEALGYRESV